MTQDSSVGSSHDARSPLSARVWRLNDWYLHRIPGGAGLLRPRQVINLQKERSMSRYPEHAAWVRRTGFLIPSVSSFVRSLPLVFRAASR